MLDCMLLPLSVIWVPTMSGPCTCWVLPDVSHSSSFRIKRFLQYDPPHLMKCTRNIFLKYDVQFQSELMHNQLPNTAKWEHILNVYQWDKKNIVRLLYKLTDAHLATVAQDATKVSLVAQVMSHTAGASLNSLACQGKEHHSSVIVL